VKYNKIPRTPYTHLVAGSLPQNKVYIRQLLATYDHRLKRTGHPVRSAIHKLEIGGLVVGWVTTSEYPLLYVFCPFIYLQIYFVLGPHLSSSAGSWLHLLRIMKNIMFIHSTRRSYIKCIPLEGSNDYLQNEDRMEGLQNL
jgi:hypothetical protein